MRSRSRQASAHHARLLLRPFVSCTMYRPLCTDTRYVCADRRASQTTSEGWTDLIDRYLAGAGRRAFYHTQTPTPTPTYMRTQTAERLDIPRCDRSALVRVWSRRGRG